MKQHLLVQELVNLTNRNKDGSFSTQAARKDILVMVGKQLLEDGYRNMGVTSLKPKHVQHLIERWKNENLSQSTIKNRVPKDQSYIERLKQYEYATARAGMSKLHGLRHEYAQARYKELAGWESPAKGGPRSKELTAEQKEIDLKVRLQISQELGHNREAITAVYLGR